MFKKSILITGLCCLVTVTGCMNPNEENVYEKSGNTVNVLDRNELYNEDGVRNAGDKMKNFGYVRHQKSPIPGDQKIYSEIPKMDREVVADLISKISTTIPHVNDVATLVTDEEVLIVYDTDSDDRFETADQVKKTGLSVVPRYYHVYVSDDPNLMEDIERFGRLDATSRNVDQIITTTIKSMLESPQGRDISTGENENGEMSGGMNNQYERKMNNLPKNLQNPSSDDAQQGNKSRKINSEDNDEGETESRGRTTTQNQDQ
jgi:hypothetical protein